MPRVLIVDDSALVRRATARQFSRALGVPADDVLVAANAFEAAELFRKHPDISIVFSDTEMPGRLGPEFFLDIREELALRGGVFVAMTGGCDEELREWWWELKVTLLEKPISPDMLVGHFLPILQERS